LHPAKRKIQRVKKRERARKEMEKRLLETTAKRNEINVKNQK
jgi:hypothetical protein